MILLLLEWLIIILRIFLVTKVSFCQIRFKFNRKKKLLQTIWCNDVCFILEEWFWHFLILFGNCGDSSVQHFILKKEKFIFVINFVWILFLIGALGYYLILPLAINFGLLFTISDSITQLFDFVRLHYSIFASGFRNGIGFLISSSRLFLTTIGILTPVF